MTRSVSSAIALVLIAGCALVGLQNCGKNENSPSGPDDHSGPIDTIPPAIVDDLRVRTPTSNSLAVVWTSPGDDGDTGTAAAYDLRFSKSPIDVAGWGAATPVDPDDVPPPLPAGRVETVVVHGLASATDYYFALKTKDEKGNESELSNCAGAKTLAEQIPPSPVTDLVATAVSDTSFELSFTAPGDDWMSGKVSQYEVRYSTAPIVTEADWSGAEPFSTVPAPAAEGGQGETMTVSGCPSRQNVFIVLKASDALGNWSSISNSAPGMALSKLLWVYPLSIVKGESVRIWFRSIGPQELQVGLYGNVGWSQCSEYLLEVITSGVFSPGVHSVTYDFRDPNTHLYRESGDYYILLCRNATMVAPAVVHFER